MNCKTCGKKLDLKKDIQNIKMGNEMCMVCWRGARYDYY